MIDGTLTTEIVDQAGQVHSREVRDVVSGQVLSSEVYSNFDEQNRPRHVAYLDGTSTDTTYGCCHIDSFTDREGTTTSYAYDDLKRRVAATRNGLRLIDGLDAANFVQAVKAGLEKPLMLLAG